jgi:hypothetical protein
MAHVFFIIDVQYLNAQAHGGDFRQHLQGRSRSFLERVPVDRL